jgi:toxin YoeB
MQSASFLPWRAPVGEASHPNPLLNCARKWGWMMKSAAKSDRPQQRDAVFQTEFREDLRYWAATNRKTALRLLDLVEAIMRDPFSGIGKPEPLKYLGVGVWSRRLTQEHRVVYLVTDDRVDFLQARYHY